MNTYFRVETYDLHDDCTRGGFVSSLCCLFYVELNMDPHKTNDTELVEAIKKYHGTNQTIRRLCGMLNTLLGDVNIPEIYDGDNYVCLFKPSVFPEKEVYFEILDDYLSDYFPNYRLVYYEFELPDETIVYEDSSQVVITKTDYEKYKPEAYEMIWCVVEQEYSDDYKDEDEE